MMLRPHRPPCPPDRSACPASNMGWRTHEPVILPLTADAAAFQRTTGPDGEVAEAGSLGEASASDAEGSGEGINAGVGWTTATPAAGTTNWCAIWRTITRSGAGSNGPGRARFPAAESEPEMRAMTETNGQVARRRVAGTRIKTAPQKAAPEKVTSTTHVNV